MLIPYSYQYPMCAYFVLVMIFKVKANFSLHSRSFVLFVDSKIGKPESEKKKNYIFKNEEIVKRKLNLLNI